MGIVSKQHDIAERGLISNEPGILVNNLNVQEKLKVRANCFASQVFPQTGCLILGDTGIEFRTLSNMGYVQIPWESIQKVIVDVLGKHHVRAITIETDDTAPLEFVISRGNEVVRLIAQSIGKERLALGPKNIRTLGRRIKAWFVRHFVRGTMKKTKMEER